jgi:hypothetical protein
LICAIIVFYINQLEALELAPKDGWVVVSMKNDWKEVFE